MSEIRWLSGISGNWTNPSDWAGGVVPGPFDDVEIDAGGVYTVTISSAVAANSLTLDAAAGTIAIGHRGALSVGAALNLEAGTLDLYSGGLIKGGTLSASGGVFLASGGMIDGVTIEGAINITTSGSGLIVGPHGLKVEGSDGTGRGTINVTGIGLVFQGSQTIDNAAINLNRAGLSSLTLSTLTLGANASVNQVGAYMSITAASLVNNGTIDAGYNSGKFTITGFGSSPSFLNNNIISIYNGDAAFISSENFVNTGQVNVSGSGSLLTIDAHALTNAGTIALKGGGIDLNALGAVNGAIRNQSGAVIYATAGSRIEIDGNLYNSGTMMGTGLEVYVDAGGIFNTGSFSISNSNFNFLNTDIAGANIAMFEGLNDTLEYDGVTVNNQGNILRVGAGSGLNPITMSDASVYGGTIVDGGGGFIWGQGEIDNLTYAGDLDTSNGSLPEIGKHGVTVTGVGGTGPGTINVTGTGSDLLLLGPLFMGGGAINLSGNGARITLDGPTTLDDATVNLGNGTGITGVGNWILGGDLTVEQQGATATISSAGLVVNYGVIDAAVAAGELFVICKAFKNVGVINVSNGDTISIANFYNLGNNQLNGRVLAVAGAGSTLELQNFVTIDAATIVLSGAGSTIEGKNGASEESLDASLTSIASNGTLELLAGRDWSSANTITNAGTLDIGAVTFAPESLVNSGTITGVGAGVISASVTNNGSLIVQAGDTLSLVGGALTNLVDDTLTGGIFTVGDGGLLQLANDTSIVTLDAILVLNGSGSVQGFDTATGSEVGLKNSLTTIGASGALEILGARDFGAANAIDNMGVLQLGGAKVSGGELTDAAGSLLGGFGVVASVFVDNGVVTASGGALAFSATGDVFKGALGGQEIDFTGGSDLLTTSSGLTAGTVGLSGGAVVTVDPALTFAGSLSESSATLTLAGKTLTLSGTAMLASKAIVNGTGKLAISAGGAVVGSAGSGTALVGVAITDAGRIEAAAGTLDLTQALTGAGAMRIDAGATLEVDGAAVKTLTTTFAGSGASLSLGAVAKFASVIAGFAGADVIELIKTAATAATLETGDRLLITNGSQTVATLNLSGSYVGDTFAVKMDQAGDARITVTGGKGADAPPPAPGANLFSQQMAALGAGPGLSIQPGSNEIGRTWPLGLTRPVAV